MVAIVTNFICIYCDEFFSHMGCKTKALCPKCGSKRLIEETVGETKQRLEQRIKVLKAVHNVKTRST